MYLPPPRSAFIPFSKVTEKEIETGLLKIESLSVPFHAILFLILNYCFMFIRFFKKIRMYCNPHCFI